MSAKNLDEVTCDICVVLKEEINLRTKVIKEVEEGIWRHRDLYY